jgi:hypothetical protein
VLHCQLFLTKQPTPGSNPSAALPLHPVPSLVGPVPSLVKWRGKEILCLGPPPRCPTSLLKPTPRSSNTWSWPPVLLLAMAAMEAPIVDPSPSARGRWPARRRRPPPATHPQFPVAPPPPGSNLVKILAGLSHVDACMPSRIVRYGHW